MTQLSESERTAAQAAPEGHASPRDVVQRYIDAFATRDLDACLAVYDDDATLDFPPSSTYRGKQDLEEWHKARFANNLQVVRVDDIAVAGETVTVEGVITSKRLKVWLIGKISGRAIFRVRDGKIADVRFRPKNDNILKMNR